MTKREDIEDDVLIEFVNHPWFDYFYWDVLYTEQNKLAKEIIDKDAEKDETKYTKSQVDRLVYKVVEKLMNAPQIFIKELALNNNPLLRDIARLKDEFLIKE